MNARVISGILVLMLLASTIVDLLTYIPVQDAIILGVAGVLAFIGWRLTANGNPVESQNVIKLYPLEVAIQTIHSGAEGAATKW